VAAAHADIYVRDCPSGSGCTIIIEQGRGAHIGRCPTQQHIQEAPFTVGANDEEVHSQALGCAEDQRARLAELEHRVTAKPSVGTPSRNVFSFCSMSASMRCICASR